MAVRQPKKTDVVINMRAIAGAYFYAEFYWKGGFFYEQKAQGQASKAEAAWKLKISDFAVAIRALWPETQEIDVIKHSKAI